MIPTHCFTAALCAFLPRAARGALVSFIIAATCAFANADDVRTFDIPSGEASAALKAFGDQTGKQLLYSLPAVRGVRTHAVNGQMTDSDALNQMLAGTSLVAERDERSGAFAVRKETETEAKNVERAIAESSARPKKKSDLVENENGEKVIKLDTFEVFGRKTLNMDIQRTRDDVQPYVVFDRETIENSAVTDLSEFFKKRLTMGISSSSGDVAGSTSGNQSSIALRGLGPEQTLILVDGHRLPSVSRVTAPTVGGQDVWQPDINGIPLAAVERIEVLPATASGIYGGGAVGGVINIILKRNYASTELVAAYANTEDFATSMTTLNFSSGFAFGQKTRVMLNGGYVTSGDPLFLYERKFADRGRNLLVANAPSAFGIPPIGLTPNVVSQDGSNLQLKNGATLGSPHTSVPVGYSGISGDSGVAFVANAGHFNYEFPNDGSGLLAALVNTPEKRSLGGNLRREIGEAIEVFVDASWFENTGHSFNSSVNSVTAIVPQTVATNPFASPVQVALSVANPHQEISVRSETTRLLFGVVASLPGDWHAEIDYEKSRSVTGYTQYNVQNLNTAALQAAIANGTLNVFKDINAYPLDLQPYSTPFEPTSGPSVSRTISENVRFGGPAIVPAVGRLDISANLQHRKEIADAAYLNTSPSSLFYYPSRWMTSDSGYIEIAYPLIASFNEARWAKALEFTGAYRMERVKLSAVPNFGIPVLSREEPLPVVTHTTRRFQSDDFTAGVRYSPTSLITLRASAGSGFLAPSFSQIAPTETLPGFLVGPDPKRPGSPRLIPNVVQSTSGNPNIRPELSRSYSAGAVLTLVRAWNLRASIDYTKIEKKDEIYVPKTAELLAFEDQFSDRITRGSNLATDQPGWAGPITRLDRSAMNVSRTLVEAWDTRLDFSWHCSGGLWALYASGTWQSHLARQLLPTIPKYDSVGYSGGPLEWRGNVGASWRRGAWSVEWDTQYYDSFSVRSATSSEAINNAQVVSQGAERIPSQIYSDVFVKYRARSGHTGFAAILNDLEVSLSVQNVFNEFPPPLAISGPITYAAPGDPRLRRFVVSFKKEL